MENSNIEQTEAKLNDLSGKEIVVTLLIGKLIMFVVRGILEMENMTIRLIYILFTQIKCGWDLW